MNIKLPEIYKINRNKEEVVNGNFLLLLVAIFMFIFSLATLIQFGLVIFMFSISLLGLLFCFIWVAKDH